MISKIRKTVPVITQRGLNKLKYADTNGNVGGLSDGLGCCLTPVEVLCLCWYFEVPVTGWVVDKVRNGYCYNGWHWFTKPENFTKDEEKYYNQPAKGMFRPFCDTWARDMKNKLRKVDYKYQRVEDDRPN